MLRTAVASAGRLWSTLVTAVAPPAAACTENPPVQANTSSTRAPVGHRADARPVVALVEEVPGLLAVHDVGLERQPVLEERHRLVGQLAEQRPTPSTPPTLPPAAAQHDAPPGRTSASSAPTTASTCGSQAAV